MERAAKQIHGGGAAKVDQVDKHHADQTGQQVGQPPMAGQPAGQPVATQMVQ